MSLKDAFPAEMPAQTRAVMEPWLKAESVYRLVGEVGVALLGEIDFEVWYGVKVCAASGTELERFSLQRFMQLSQAGARREPKQRYLRACCTTCRHTTI